MLQARLLRAAWGWWWHAPLPAPPLRCGATLRERRLGAVRSWQALMPGPAGPAGTWVGAAQLREKAVHCWRCESV